MSNIICKVLGIAYLIPWLILMGSIEDQQSAQALYNVAYLPYALFLSLGTAGFPSGISKKIAQTNTTTENNKAIPLFQSGLAVMEIIGILSALLMFIAAPLLSSISPIVNHSAGITAIRSLCFSLLIIPILSALRGYFQGINLTVHFGISQVIEQFVRVVVILLGTFIIRVIFQGSVLSAVILSTVASSIGGIISIFYLIWAGKKEDILRITYFLSPPIKLVKKNRNTALEIIKESLPFVYAGSVITILQLIDQISLKPIYGLLFPIVNSVNIETLFTISSANPNKLAPLLLSIIISISITSLPLLSIVSTKLERQSTIADILRLTFTFLAPASIGMLLLSVPLNTMFFGYNLDGSIYLASTIITMFFLGIYTVLLSVLQALNAHRKAVSFTTKLIILKFILQLPSIYLFKGLGLSLSTTFSTLLVSINIYHFIVKEFDIHPLAYTKRYLIKVIGSTLIMSFSCFILILILAKFLKLTDKFQSIVIIIIIASSGGVLFLSSLFKERLRSKLNNFITNSKS